MVVTGLLSLPIATTSGEHADFLDALFTATSSTAAGGLVIEDGVIVQLLAAGEAPPAPCGQVFDAREHVVLPGLINTHHHFYQTLTRAWAPVVNQPLFPWLKTLYPVWARLTPEKLAVASTVALTELLLSGCTTAADHHYLFPDGLEEAIDVQVEAVRALGMRAMLTRGSMSLGEKDGGLPPRVLALKACAVATSGDRWHRFEQDGTRYSHTLDPRRGRPVEQAAAAVSVLAATAMEADAWATALTVMGLEAGLAFARAHGLAARFVVRGAHGASEHMTPQFEAALAA